MASSVLRRPFGRAVVAAALVVGVATSCSGASSASKGTLSFTAAAATMSGSRCGGVTGAAPSGAGAAAAASDEDLVFNGVGLRRVHADGTDLRDFGPPLGGGLSWTADRKRVVGSTGEALEVLDVGSRTATTIAGTGSTDLAFAISPDGQRVAIQRDNRELLITQISNGHVDVRITLALVSPLGPPQWSPDGTTLLVLADQVGEELVDTATGSQRRLSPGVESAAWSPDGTIIAAALSDPATTDGLYALNLAQRQATPLARADPHIAITDPVWSPDGRHIAFVTTDFSSYSSQPDLLCVIAVQSGTVAAATSPMNSIDQPAWSSDSTSLAYVATSTLSDGPRLHTNTATGDHDQVVPLPANVIADSPIWISNR